MISTNKKSVMVCRTRIRTTRWMVAGVIDVANTPDSPDRRVEPNMVARLLQWVTASFTATVNLPAAVITHLQLVVLRRLTNHHIPKEVSIDWAAARSFSRPAQCRRGTGYHRSPAPTGSICLSSLSGITTIDRLMSASCLNVLPSSMPVSAHGSSREAAGKTNGIQQGFHPIAVRRFHHELWFVFSRHPAERAVALKR